MKIIIYALLVFSLFGWNTNTHAQLRYGYASSGVGLGKMMPSLKKEVQSKPWTTFQFRQRIFELQVAWGDFTYLTPESPDYISDNAMVFNAGFNFPLHRFTLVNRGHHLFGLHVVPLIGVHYSVHSMGRANGKNVGQNGINVAPALSVQFPFGMIDLRLNNGFYFGKNSRDEMKKYRSGNYMFSPAISLQLDGLFEILGGRTTAAGDYSYNYRVLEDEEVKYNEDRTTKTTTRKYNIFNSSGESYVSIQNAFWYISGKFTNGFTPVLNYPDATESYTSGNGFGFGIGGRFKGFMGDISFEKNNGFYAIRDPSLVEELESVGSAYPLVEGRFNATEIRGKAGFDILTAITNIIAPSRNRKLKNLSGNWVKFSRLHGGLSGGFGIPGKVKVYTPEGEAALDAFFSAHPEIERNSQTDITAKNGLTWNIGLFLNWEMGPVSLEYDWHGHHNYGWRSSIGIAYLLPLQELAKSLKE